MMTHEQIRDKMVALLHKADELKIDQSRSILFEWCNYDNPKAPSKCCAIGACALIEDPSWVYGPGTNAATIDAFMEVFQTPNGHDRHVWIDVVTRLNDTNGLTFQQIALFLTDITREELENFYLNSVSEAKVNERLARFKQETPA